MNNVRMSNEHVMSFQYLFILTIAWRKKFTLNIQLTYL